MRGRAEVKGAVTVVNAISIGKGAAIGIDLRMAATVELTDDGVFSFRCRGQEADDSVARTAFKLVAERKALSGKGCRVEVESEIPVAVGLKSSSAAASAVTLALFDAIGEVPRYWELLDLVSEVSIRSGTSITGAADDASACMLGGFVVTDNRRRALLMRSELEERLMAVISVPEGRRTFTSSFRREDLLPIRGLVEVAFELAMRGDYIRAMTLNGLVHSAALGYGTDVTVAALRKGALACSISGTGPAIAALCYEENVDEVREALGSYGETRVVKVNNQPATFGSRRVSL
ncbi:MAG: shikimate kinase [Aigarchaeota archaeon]|nr:shikimate kinase [Candidatus Calditenuis fumarioli]